MMRYLLKILFLLGVFQQVFGQEWNKVYNMEPDAPGISMIYNSGNNLLISGSFDSINHIEMNKISCFDGINWNSLSNGLMLYSTEAIYYDGMEFFGGSAMGAGGDYNKDMLVNWDGSNWGGFGSSTGTIYDLEVYLGGLYAVGFFDDVFGLQNLNGILRYDGNSFYHLTTGNGLNGGPLSVDVLAVYDSLLLIGGLIYSANDTLVSNLAAWDGSTYSSYAGGVNAWLQTMFVDTVNEYLYVGGDFTVVGGVLPVSYFAKWDGQNWFDVGGGGDCLPTDFEIYQNQLYATGCFQQISGKSIKGIARFNGLEWDSLAIAANPGANVMEVFQDELYVGGSFTQIGDTIAPGLAKWSYPLDSACKEMYAGIGIHPDTIYTGQLPYTFRSGCYGNSSLQWEFSDGYTNGKGHCAYNFNNTPGTYDIMLTAQCGTEADTVYSQVVIVSNAGIEDPMDQLNNGINVTIFPNPSEGNITISSSELKGKEVQVSIYDLQGKQVYQKQLKFSSETLQLALDLPKGSYQLELIEGGRKVVQQIVVE